MESFFRKYLRTGQHWNKKLIGISDAKWQPLSEDTYIDQWKFAKGSLFKCFETTNFGWIVFHPESVLTDGTKPYRRIFKW